MANQVKIQIEAKANLAAIDEAIAKLKALKDKRIKVDIDVDNAAMRKLDNIRDKRIKVDVDVQDSKIRALRDRRVKVTVDVDSGSLNALQSRLAAMQNQTVRVRVRATEDRVNEQARNLIRNRTATINVALAGLAAAEAQLTALARNRRMSIRVDMDAAGAAALHAILTSLQNGGNLGNNANRIAGGMSNMASSGSRLATMLPVIAALAPAIGVLGTGAITAGIYGTAAALGAVTAVAGGIGAAVTTGLAAIPIAAAATNQEVKDHFTYMKNDVVNTMKDIAQPVQQPLINMATALGAAFHQMRPQLENITRGTADLVNHLSGKLPEIAGQLGPALEKAFNAGVPHVKNLVNSLPRLTESFGNFMQSLGSPEVVAGAQRIFESMPGWIEGAGRGIENLATGFNNVMGFFDSGKMDGFTEGFGQMIDNFSGVDWSGVTSGLSGAATAFGDFLGSIDGQAVAGGIENITGALTNLTTVATGVSDSFNFIDEKIRSLTSAGGKDGMGMWDGLKNMFGFNNQAVTDAWAGVVDAISQAQGAGGAEVNIPVKVTPEVEPLDPGQALGGLGDSGFTIPILGEFTVPEPPAIPPPTVPLNFEATPFAVPQLPPVTQPIEPGPMPAPPAPAPVPVPIEVQGVAEVPKPAPVGVDIQFNVENPTIDITVPPIPLSFNVTMPDISIPPVEAQATVTVTSNASQVAAEINALSAGTNSFHTVSSNVAAVAGEIQSLNGQNTSSTHTINVVKTGDTGPVVPR